MPKYTITTEADDGPERFDGPIEFRHDKAATDDAQIALAEMARDKLPNGKRADFRVTVDDEGGKPIYQAELRFAAKTAEDIAQQDREADAAADEVAASLGGRGPRE